MSYRRTVSLPVTPDEAFALITQPERLRRWSAVTATIDLRAGGAFRWNVTPGHVATGTVREVEPGRRVVYGWGWEGEDDLPPDTSTLTITVTPTATGADVTLEHEGLTAAQEASHAEGWDHFLARLADLGTTGDAGPDEWAWAPENLTPIVAAEATLAVLQPVLRGLTTEDKSKQTPCAEFTCHDLAEHLMGSLTKVAAMAGATVEVPADGSLEDKVSSMATAAIDAWRTIDLDGEVPGPDGDPLPAVAPVLILSIEFLIHAWDFARASGQEVRASDDVVRYVAEHGGPIIDGARDRGSFAMAVDASDDLTELERLAAFSGRELAA